MRDFYFTDKNVIKSAKKLFQWNVCSVKWADCKFSMGREEGIVMETGGLLKPLSLDLLLYNSACGKTVTLPSKSDTMLLPILEALDRDESPEIPLKEVKNYVKFFRKIKSKFTSR